MADAIVAPAVENRRRQVEARQSQLLDGTSLLSAVPEAEREFVLRAAQEYSSRRWYVYVPVVAGAALWFGWFFAPEVLGITSLEKPPPALLLVVGLMTLGLKRYAMRSYVRRGAAKYRGGPVPQEGADDV